MLRAWVKGSGVAEVTLYSQPGKLQQLPYSKYISQGGLNGMKEGSEDVQECGDVYEPLNFSGHGGSLLLN